MTKYTLPFPIQMFDCVLVPFDASAKEWLEADIVGIDLAVGEVWVYVRTLPTPAPIRFQFSQIRSIETKYLNG